MRILLLAVLLLLLCESASKIHRTQPAGSRLGRQHHEYGLRVLRKVHGQINHILNTPGADYRIVKEWTHNAPSRHYWLWLKDKLDDSIVASVKLEQDRSGTVKVTRAVRGLELPF